MNYRRVDSEVQELARSVMLQHHPHLRTVRVDFLFREKAAMHGPKVVLGKARRISGLTAFLADDEGQPFFVIELAEDEWENLSPRARRALIDHELSHCWVTYDEDTGAPELSMRPHDVEEFSDIVRRHGTWKRDLADFSDQLALALAEPQGIT